MNKKIIKKILPMGLIAGVCVAGGLVLYAYARTWGKTEIEFNIHINEQRILESVFGESPTFAIWLENPDTRETKTIFVTQRAGEEDWEGKVEVPSALPLWDKINKQEKQKAQGNEDIDAVSGATPQPGYFTTRVRVKPGSKWNCWIEMNLAGDYNDSYPEYDEETKMTDDYGTGQPALVYKASIEAIIGNMAIPDIIGISLFEEEGKVVCSLTGVTTALDVFDEMTIKAVKPKPKILSNKIKFPWT